LLSNHISKPNETKRRAEKRIAAPAAQKITQLRNTHPCFPQVIAANTLADASPTPIIESKFGAISNPTAFSKWMRKKKL
jgi:hypothetical protein